MARDRLQNKKTHLSEHKLGMGEQGVAVLKVVWVVLAAVAVAESAAATQAKAKPGCPDRCGNISIPYPFGTRKDCSLSEEFLITCDNTTSPPKAFLWESDINITSITAEGELHVLKYIATDCYNRDGIQNGRNDPSLTLSAFSISGALNKFVVVGCDTYGHLTGHKGKQLYRTGCMSICSSENEVTEGSCSGAGCCEVSFPEGLTNVDLTARSYFNHTEVWEFNPCSYSFVVQDGAFNFSSKNLSNLRDGEKLPMVINWSIGNIKTCAEAQRNQTSYACKENSACYPSKSGSGYICKCFDGYDGNPYLGGCQDINECDDPKLNKCFKKKRCKNIQGNYTCSCPKGFHGDGREDGGGCTPNKLQIVQIALGISIGFLALIIGSSWMFWVYKRRKFIKLKEKFFEKNGGFMLQQQLSGPEGSTETIKIFSAEELEKATDKYAESKIIGRGGYGTVYKGTLTDGRIVAIKKSMMVDTSQIEQFINEVLVLSQINHRNVVKLLGCCLETAVPLLVYEFVSHGTLFDYIHNEKKISTISWDVRLRIATEVAEVLSYLHSAASTPIIHRDVKSTNILLDENYTAKVSDFGASRLVPLDQTQLSTMVQGTLGYLDPEYLLTSQLTEKSDVYSFGVVLVELLTAEKALSFDRPEEKRSLSMHFLSSLKDDRLVEILDKRIVNKETIEQVKEAASLAERCLQLKGDERPAMKEVAMTLQRMRMVEIHAWTDPTENEGLPGESSKTFGNVGRGTHE